MAILESDVCPKCKERRLPAIEEGTKATARCCQRCGQIFEIKDGKHVEHLDQDVKK